MSDEPGGRPYGARAAAPAVLRAPPGRPAITPNPTARHYTWTNSPARSLMRRLSGLSSTYSSRVCMPAPTGPRPPRTGIAAGSGRKLGKEMPPRSGSGARVQSAQGALGIVAAITVMVNALTTEVARRHSPEALEAFAHINRTLTSDPDIIPPNG